ncbi:MULTISPECIES: hypothetical protein [Halomonas]|jgi:hypothetical protein|uniref:hypothetical protein n=1 Tax=Halomonas TaxID=2745 RepID=UPI000E5B9DF1|nr:MULTISPECIES: hypothetical protein [Halomonas]AXY40937.1 hypothetical protein D1793_01220 [Halomonas sp. JS92-SW72]
MTNRTATCGHAASATDSTRQRLACLLAELDGDTLVRPELRDAAILGARRPARAQPSSAPTSLTPAGRS